MNIIKLEKIHNRIIEISSLTHVLQVALDNTEQQTKDTTPFADLASIIRHKINCVLEEISKQRRIY